MISCRWCGVDPIDEDFAPCCGPDHLKKLAKEEHEQAEWDRGFEEERDDSQSAGANS